VQLKVGGAFQYAGNPAFFRWGSGVLGSIVLGPPDSTTKGHLDLFISSVFAGLTVANADKTHEVAIL